MCSGLNAPLLLSVNSLGIIFSDDKKGLQVISVKATSMAVNMINEIKKGECPITVFHNVMS